MNRVPSLRVQLLARLAAPLLIVILFDAGLSFYLARHFANSAYDHWLLDSAHSLGSQIKVTAGAPKLELAGSAREMFEWDARDRVYFQVRSESGDLLEGSATLAVPAPSVKESEPIYFQSIVDGATVRGVVIRLRATGATQDVRIAVAETLQKRQFLAREILAIVLLPQFVLLACTGLLVWSGVTAGLTSLRRVSRDLEGKDHRDLAPVVMEDVPQEMRPIIDRLNELLNRVASMLRHQRNFIADAAHQIRTPLAAVKLQVESLARDDPPARLKPQIEALGRATDRAVHLSQQLLTLARAEPAHNPRDAFIDVELAEIVRASAGPLLPRALQAGMTAEFIASPEHIVMRGDPILLGELVSNLVDNAIRYGRGGTTIIVRLTASPTVTLAVEDDGPGIPLDAIDRVFDRFFRSDQSTPGGTGLGLSIVKEIAETHSAVASIRTRPQFPGTCVVVSFAQSQARSMSEIPIAGLV